MKVHIGWSGLLEWASNVQHGKAQWVVPDCLSVLVEPPLTELVPTVAPVAKEPADAVYSASPLLELVVSRVSGPTSQGVQQNLRIGFLLAASAHLIFLISFLWLSGSAGALRPASIETLEVELVTEPSGEAAVDATEPPEVTVPVLIGAETAQKPIEIEARLTDIPTETSEVSATEVSPQEQQSERELEPLVWVEPLPISGLPPDAAKAIVPPKPEAKKAAATKAARQGRDTVSGDNSSSVDAYKIAVASKIAANKPPANTAASAQGVVMISFTILPDGKVGESKISQTSGHRELDQAGLATIIKSSPFPSPPIGAPRTFTVPIRFNVR